MIKKERGGLKMEILEVKLTPVEDIKKTQDNEFLKELAEGYLEVEISKKKALLKEYSKAYDNLQDKDSFNGQYLETLISILRDELKDN